MSWVWVRFITIPPSAAEREGCHRKDGRVCAAWDRDCGSYQALFATSSAFGEPAVSRILGRRFVASVIISGLAQTAVHKRYAVYACKFACCEGESVVALSFFLEILSWCAG
jgi:hypothetical protein